MHAVAAEVDFFYDERLRVFEVALLWKHLNGTGTQAGGNKFPIF
jgi:hypothetical protein